MGRLFLLAYAVFATVAIIILYRKYKELNFRLEKKSSEEKKFIPSEFIDIINSGLDELKKENESISIKEGIDSSFSSSFGNVSDKKLSESIEDAIGILKKYSGNLKEKDTDLIDKAVSFLRDSGYSIDTYFDMFGVERYSVKGNNYIM